MYTTQLGDGVYEITTMADESAEGQDAVSWGQEARLEQMLNHYPVRRSRSSKSLTGLG